MPFVLTTLPSIRSPPSPLLVIINLSPEFSTRPSAVIWNISASFIISAVPLLLITFPEMIKSSSTEFVIVSLVPLLVTVPETSNVLPWFNKVAKPLLLVTLPAISKLPAPSALVMFKEVPSLMTSPSAPTVSLP